MKTPTNMICIGCPFGCELKIDMIDGKFVITGNKCPHGKKYAIEEMTAPKRIVTSTVKVINGLSPVVSVKTSKPIPKEKIFTIMKILVNFEVVAPVKINDLIIKNVADTGVDVVATKAVKQKAVR